jgi:hypothetical protein
MTTENEIKASASKSPQANPVQPGMQKAESPPVMWVVVAILMIVAVYFVAR